jgi:hypothetical protein
LLLAGFGLLVSGRLGVLLEYLKAVFKYECCICDRSGVYPRLPPESAGGFSPLSSGIYTLVLIPVIPGRFAVKPQYLQRFVRVIPLLY